MRPPNSEFNVYCDESCHLEHDFQPRMFLGALWCPLDRAATLNAAVEELKCRHDFPAGAELKWNKVSPAKSAFYRAVAQMYLNEPDLQFRILVADKTRLNHGGHGQDHDTWYYKMYYQLLCPLVSRRGRYYIYLDQKDTRGGRKVRRLHEILCSTYHDFDRQAIRRLQIVESKQVALLQLCDLLVGIVKAAHDQSERSSTKAELVRLLELGLGHGLCDTTAADTQKFNLFHWSGRRG